MTIRRFVNNILISGELPYMKVNNEQVVCIIKEINMKIIEERKKENERKKIPN